MKKKKSANEEKVLRLITTLSCVVRKMSAIGRGGKRPKMENQWTCACKER